MYCTMDFKYFEEGHCWKVRENGAWAKIEPKLTHKEQKLQKLANEMLEILNTEQ